MVKFSDVPVLKYLCGLSSSMKYGFPVGVKDFKGLLEISLKWGLGF